jgi:hypothetical protein
VAPALPPHQSSCRPAGGSSGDPLYLRMREIHSAAPSPPQKDRVCNRIGKQLWNLAGGGRFQNVGCVREQPAWGLPTSSSLRGLRPLTLRGGGGRRPPAVLPWAPLPGPPQYVGWGALAVLHAMCRDNTFLT